MVRSRRPRASTRAIALAAGAIAAAATGAAEPAGLEGLEGLTPWDTPPRGFNSWQAFRYWITEDEVLGVGAAMAERGFVDKHYRYLVIDEGQVRTTGVGRGRASVCVLAVESS